MFSNTYMPRGMSRVDRGHISESAFGVSFHPPNLYPQFLSPTSDNP